MRQGDRIEVVVDTNVLDGLKLTALPREGFEYVLGKVLYAEILGRRLKALQSAAKKQRRAARGFRAARVLLEGETFAGRVSVGESMEDILYRESRPGDVGTVHAGVVAGSVASLDSWRGKLPDFRKVLKGDLRVQHEFNKTEIDWVNRVDLTATELLELQDQRSIGCVNERLIDRVAEEEIRGAIAWMAKRLYGNQFDDEWREFITSSPENCMASAVGRVAALSLHYTLVRAEGPEQRIENFANNFRDLQYAVLASYTGAICTEDKGLIGACESVFGNKITVFARDEIFDVPNVLEEDATSR